MFKNVKKFFKIKVKKKKKWKTFAFTELCCAK